MTANPDRPFPGPAQWRMYPRIRRIGEMAARDVGRGSETLMTFSRGSLFRAAWWLGGAMPARALVVTGFYIPGAAHPAAETDGPLGALELCAALRACGGDAWLVTDDCCAPVIGGAASGVLPDDRVLVAPVEPRAFERWMGRVARIVDDRRIDTLVYIERVGPSADGRPHNMRGRVISAWTAPLSRLTRLRLHVIGVGDGGNEIGMGSVADYAIAGVVDHGELIACTVPADETIVAGTSNWGAHALVCAMRTLGRGETDPYLDTSWHRGVLDALVAHGGLDGVDLENRATVDGLPPERYFSQIEAMSRLARS